MITPNRRRVFHSSHRLMRWYQKSCILWVSYVHEWPLPQVGISEGEQVVIKYQQPIPRWVQKIK